VLSSVAGSLVGIGVLITKKESLKYALPFGTFLAVAAMVAAVAGDSLVNWYLQYYQ
jgi:leader peptidase (prepilin peptidase)/N-methyltransferase